MIESGKTLGETFIKKGFWLYVFSFIIAPLGYIIKIIISNDISVSEVGILYGVISLVTLLSAFSDFGVKESLSYFIPRFHNDNELHKTKTLLVFSFFIQLITGAIIFCIFFWGAPFLSSAYFKSESAIYILQVFAFFFLGLNIFQLIGNFFLAIQNTFLQKGLEFLRMISITLGVVLLWWQGWGNIVQYAYMWLAGLYIGVFLSVAIFFSIYYKKYFAGVSCVFDRDLLKKIFSYALITFFTIQSFFILSQIDMQMVLYFLGAKEAGYYTNYLSLVSIPNTILGPIFLLLYPVFSQLHAQGKLEKIREIKSIFQKQFLVIALSFSLLLFMFAVPVTHILFGEKFQMSGTILQYGILFIAWNFLLRINQIILASTGNPKKRLYIVLIAIFINIVGNFIGIYFLGASGVALATGISWLFVWYISEKMTPEYKTKFDIKFLFSNSVFFALSAVCMYTILPIFADISRIVGLGVFLGISCIYAIFFILWNIKELKKCIREVKLLRKK